MRLLWREKLTAAAFKTLEIFLDAEKIDPFVSLKQLSPSQLQKLMNGSNEDHWYRAPQGFKFRWMGINNVLAKAAKNATSLIRETIIPILNENECISCKGSRLNPLARNVTINNLGISTSLRNLSVVFIS
jgi:excinuclease ABC subunit A